MRKWQDEVPGAADFWVAVNVSARQLVSDDLAAARVDAPPRCSASTHVIFISSSPSRPSSIPLSPVFVSSTPRDRLAWSS